MRIFLADDERETNAILLDELTQAAFTVDAVYTAKDALRSVRAHAYDLAIVDWMFRAEKQDGIDIIRALRERQSYTPIVMITARASLMRRIEGLRAGADDIVPKPVHAPELLARVNAHLRYVQCQQTCDASGRLALGAVVLCLFTHSVWVEHRAVPMSKRLFQLLRYLMAQGGRVVPREELLEHVWGDHSLAYTTNTVDKTVDRLRRKLGTAKDMIVTVPGVGFILQEKG